MQKIWCHLGVQVVMGVGGGVIFCDGSSRPRWEIAKPKNIVTRKGNDATRRNQHTQQKSTRGTTQKHTIQRNATEHAAGLTSKHRKEGTRMTDCKCSGVTVVQLSIMSRSMRY